MFKSFDSSGKAVFDSTQVAGQQGYGSLDFELAPGSYTFVAVAHDVARTGNPAVANPDAAVKAAVASPTQASLPEALVQDAFCKSLAVNIEPALSFTADLELPRIISCFQIWINDPLPANIKMFKIVANPSATAISGNPAFNPSTGLALSERQYVKEVNLSKGAGASNNSISLNLLLTAEEQNIDITTIAKGNFFAAESKSTLSFLTGWEEDHLFTY